MDNFVWDTLLNNIVDLPCVIAFLLFGVFAMRRLTPLLERILSILEDMWGEVEKLK